MDVKEAVVLAKQNLLDLYADEKVTNLSLEEVEFDESAGEWIVTLGFSRPWDEPRNSLAAIAQTYLRRTYKTVKISNDSRQILSMRTREVAQ